MLKGIVFVCKIVIFYWLQYSLHMTLPSPLEWSVLGPFSVTAPLLFTHLSPCRVKSLTSSHIGRSNVQWTGRYSDSGKKNHYVPAILTFRNCFILLQGQLLSPKIILCFKWFQDNSKYLKMLKKGCSQFWNWSLKIQFFKSILFFLNWMNGSTLYWLLY